MSSAGWGKRVMCICGWIEWMRSDFCHKFVLNGMDKFFHRGGHWTRSSCRLHRSSDLSKMLLDFSSISREICRWGMTDETSHKKNQFLAKIISQSLQFSIHTLGLLFVDLVLPWLSHVSHPTKERHALLWTIGLTLGVILGGNCGLGDFGHSVGFGNFSPVRGRNSSAPLSRLPCHLNAAYPHPLSKCQSQSATDCAQVHCKLPTCSYMVHTILPPKVPKSPELLTIAGHFNLP